MTRKKISIVFGLALFLSLSGCKSEIISDDMKEYETVKDIGA